MSSSRIVLQFFTILAACTLLSTSNRASHWRLSDNGTIVEVRDGSGSSDPLFLFLNSRSPPGKEEVTDVSPDHRHIPSAHWASDQLDVFASFVGLDASDLPNENVGDDKRSEPIASTSSNCRNHLFNTNSLPGPLSSSKDSFSSFILQSQGLSVINSHSTCPTDNKVGVDSDVAAVGRKPSVVYSRLNSSSPLTCGPPVSSTRYDMLEALQQRDRYPIRRELEVAVIFKRANSNIINLATVESELQEVLATENQPSIALLNELGNFWRVQGNTLEAVECFRSALHQQPDNADVLLNLARLLLNMGFVEDARTLTYLSLAATSPEQNSWLQHFTLADTFERSGEHEETMRELSHTLDLNPGFQPAEMLLSRLKQQKSSGFDGYLLWTATIIILLSSVVLMLLYSILICNQASAANTKPVLSSGGLVKKPSNSHSTQPFLRFKEKAAQARHDTCPCPIHHQPLLQRKS